MSIKTWVSWGVTLAAALVITYAWAPRPARDMIEPGARQSAPNFTLTDAQGKAVQLADYKDKVVLLNFWATWCGPCKVEIPWFQEFETKYKNKNFAVLGVSYDNSGWAAVKPYLKDNPINYKILAIVDETMPQPYASIDTLPTTLLIDRQGRIAATHNGLVAKADYEAGIEALLDN